MQEVLVIVGSLRKESFNLKLAHALEKLQPQALHLTVLPLNNIPLYNQDLDENLPSAVVDFKQKIIAADAIIFVTPEYNRSIPGVLKNAIDWGTRPYGKNVWTGKPAAMLGTSPGVIGTAVAQAHLRSVLTAIGMVVFALPEVYLVFKEDMIDKNYQITAEATKKYLQTFLENFKNHIS